jgi:hypothetical protein
MYTTDKTFQKGNYDLQKNKTQWYKDFTNMPLPIPHFCIRAFTGRYPRNVEERQGSDTQQQKYLSRGK